MNPKGDSKESKDLEKSQGNPKETLKDNNKHDELSNENRLQFMIRIYLRLSLSLLFLLAVLS